MMVIACHGYYGVYRAVHLSWRPDLDKRTQMAIFSA